MEEVGDQLDAVDQAGAGVAEACLGGNGVDAGRSEGFDVLPDLHRLGLDVLQVALDHDDHDFGTEAGELAPGDLGGARPGSPATSLPPAIAIISGTQRPATRTGS